MKNNKILPFEEKLFKVGIGILLLFSIIYVGSLISWFFRPILVAFQVLFIPIVLTMFLYYLLRTPVNFLSRKLPRGISILIMYALFLSLVAVIIAWWGPLLQEQFISFSNNIPRIIRNVEETVFGSNLSGALGWIDDELTIHGVVTEWLNQSEEGLLSGFGAILGTLANAILAIAIIPILLFYILKDSEKISKGFIKMFAKDQQKEVGSILKDVDTTLSTYIQGQGIVCLFVGLLCLFAYLVIGLEYALLLAVISGLTNIIPYFGPWIGSIPAVIVALFMSPITALFTVIAIIIIQQIESNVIAPQVLGKKLNIYPITIIVLILISGRMFGLIGMIIAVPLYAVFRLLITHTIKLIKVKKRKIKKA